ncbi:MAG: DUF3800 domain-containing protein [Chloroflexi bacterium]|nr:DUF3800 domain-containing protein [Chloroflexota bacterium]
MITLTFAGDEAGDVSFAFDKGASRYFAVAVIATPVPDDLRRLLARVRAESNLPANFEFKFNHLSSARLREHTLSELARAEFESWAIVVDKANLSDAYKVMRRYEFYLFFVTELLKKIPEQAREGATLILDEFGSATQLYTELNRYMKAREIPRHFKRIQVRRSRSEPLIQIADIVAGTLLRRDTAGDAEAFDFLQKRIRSVYEFEG